MFCASIHFRNEVDPQESQFILKETFNSMILSQITCQWQLRHNAERTCRRGTILDQVDTSYHIRRFKITLKFEQFNITTDIALLNPSSFVHTHMGA